MLKRANSRASSTADNYTSLSFVSFKLHSNRLIATQSADFIHGEADQSCVQYRKNDAVDIVRFGPAIGRFLCTSADYVVDGPDNYICIIDDLVNV